MSTDYRWVFFVSESCSTLDASRTRRESVKSSYVSLGILKTKFRFRGSITETKQPTAGRRRLREKRKRTREEESGRLLRGRSRPQHADRVKSYTKRLKVSKTNVLLAAAAAVNVRLSFSRARGKGACEAVASYCIRYKGHADRAAE